MIIVNVSQSELDDALNSINARFDNNIIWNRSPEPLNGAGTRWRLTLRCKSSKGLGHARARYGWSGELGRRLVSACWHVHGHFFVALPVGAIIHTSRLTTYPGSPWHDFNVGSIMYPCPASEACDCA